MKLKKLMILFGTVCILNTMAAGCGSAAEPTVKTKEAQSGEILPEEATDALIKDDDKDMEESQENTAGKRPKPEITEEDGKASPEDEENTVCDPIVGIVEKYEGNTITIKNPDDDMLYYFSTENARILEGFSTESAQEAEGDPSIAVGDKVEISYRGLIDFDEEHPSEALKIVVITAE